MLSPLTIASFALFMQTVAVPPEPVLPRQSMVEDSAKSLDQGAAGLSVSGLTSSERRSLQQAYKEKNYRAAQGLLLDRLAVERDPSHRQSFLVQLGSFYLLDHDPMQAAVAWKKAEGLAPLPTQIRFSLAMAYLQIGHNDWAEAVLQTLVKSGPANASYPFWLGRIAYDRQIYNTAIVYFRDALAIDPSFARAHDNLGLCLYALNQLDDAVAEFNTAISLDRAHPPPSAWPYLNLGVALEFRGLTSQAIGAFKQAIDVDPTFAEAHYRLGSALIKVDRLPEAVVHEQTAIRLDPNFAEPHFVLARLYRRLDRADDSRHEEGEYERLHQQNKIPAAQSTSDHTTGTQMR